MKTTFKKIVAYILKTESRLVLFKYKPKIIAITGSVGKTSTKDAPNFDMPVSKFLLFLVIHAMLHLKGYEHGSTMERQEKKFLKLFS